MSKLAWPLGIFLWMCMASTADAMVTFNSGGGAQLVQSIILYPPQSPYLPSDFGSIDIVFVNGVERLGIGLESGVLLVDENFGPPTFPHCSCLGFDDPVLDLTANRDYFVAYYFFQDIPGNDLGQIIDGLLIRRRGDILCVNAIRRTTFPIDFVTVFDEHDCLRRAIIGPSPAEILRLMRLLEGVKISADFRPPIQWPEPFCLTCPPWAKYEKERAKFAQMHEAHVRQEFKRTVENGRSFLKE